MRIKSPSEFKIKNWETKGYKKTDSRRDNYGLGKIDSRDYMTTDLTGRRGLKNDVTKNQRKTKPLTQY